MFRFTIRDALWFAVVAGLLIPWQAERYQANRQAAEDAKLYDGCITSLRELVAELQYPQPGVTLHQSIFDVPLKVADKAQARLKKAKR